MNEHSFMTRVHSPAQGILDAALSLFTEAGFAATNVPSIARRAGVATGTIYRYFPSKEQLANAVYRIEKTQMRTVLADALAAVPASAGIRAAVDACWAALLGLLADRREGVLFLEAQQHAAYLDEQSRALAAEVDELVLSVIARGQETGAIKDVDPEILVAMLYGTFVGLAKSSVPYGPDLVTLTTPLVWDLISAKDHE